MLQVYLGQWNGIQGGQVRVYRDAKSEMNSSMKTHIVVKTADFEQGSVMLYRKLAHKLNYTGCDDVSLLLKERIDSRSEIESEQDIPLAIHLNKGNEDRQKWSFYVVWFYSRISNENLASLAFFGARSTWSAM